MNPSSIIGLVALSLILLLSLWLIFRGSRSSVSYTVESTEEVDGERTLLVNIIVPILKFALREIHPDEPQTTTSPDGNRSYLHFLTMMGHVVVQFDWVAQKVSLFHSCHSDDESSTSSVQLKIRHNMVDEIKLRDFGEQVAAKESSMVERKILQTPEMKQLLMTALAQKIASEGAPEPEGSEE